MGYALVVLIAARWKFLTHLKNMYDKTRIAVELSALVTVIARAMVVHGQRTGDEGCCTLSAVCLSVFSAMDTYDVSASGHVNVRPQLQNGEVPRHSRNVLTLLRGEMILAHRGVIGVRRSQRGVEAGGGTYVYDGWRVVQ